jgi:hypothetical protein
VNKVQLVHKVSKACRAKADLPVPKVIKENKAFKVKADLPDQKVIRVISELQALKV